jgi:large subunit ribosomal protein L23
MKTIVLKPIITEKSINEANARNKYTFMVNPDANKIEIAAEIATKFDVKVKDVRVANFLGKKVRFGKKRISGVRSDYKKAIVTLEKGSKISIFELK